jgi:hypothetical protein
MPIFWNLCDASANAFHYLATHNRISRWPHKVLENQLQKNNVKHRPFDEEPEANSSQGASKARQ